MAGSKRKTTMAKLNRERKLLERRAAKQAKKDARKKAAAEERLARVQPISKEAGGPPGDLPAEPS
jgi:hypothetical protein